MRIGGSRHKCVSCDREVASFFPVPVGGTTVCACLAVMVNDNGVLRIASDAEADKPGVQRGGWVCDARAAQRAHRAHALGRRSAEDSQKSLRRAAVGNMGP
jgi:hypothetical protein